ncbi:hypothetical protein GIB67_041330, partial [Kingdonia uniflora]
KSKPKKYNHRQSRSNEIGSHSNDFTPNWSKTLESRHLVRTGRQLVRTKICLWAKF